MDTSHLTVSHGHVVIFCNQQMFLCAGWCYLGNFRSSYRILPPNIVYLNILGRGPSLIIYPKRITKILKLGGSGFYTSVVFSVIIQILFLRHIDIRRPSLKEALTVILYDVSRKPSPV